MTYLPVNFIFDESRKVLNGNIVNVIIIFTPKATSRRRRRRFWHATLKIA